MNGTQRPEFYLTGSRSFKTNRNARKLTTVMREVQLTAEMQLQLQNKMKKERFEECMNSFLRYPGLSRFKLSIEARLFNAEHSRSM